MVRILVGTLENGEAEFQECVNRIMHQKEVEIDHQVISGLSELEAHKALATLWTTRKQEFDYLVKIDADTLLLDDYSLSKMSELMIRESASGLQLKLLDYYSNSLISGLNMFSKKVKFHSKVSRLRPDNFDWNHSKVLKGPEVQFLNPIGFHGKYPNPRQSFFYGYRRYLKSQYEILWNCLAAWKEFEDEARRWAIIGAMSAHRKIFRKIRFSSEQVENQFQKIELKDFPHTNFHNFEKFLRDRV